MRQPEKILFAGIAIAVIIAIAAPFLASSNPDGLDSTAERVGVEEKAHAAYQSPMPDYRLLILGEGKISGVVALLFGVFLIAGLSYGAGFALKKKKQV